MKEENNENQLTNDEGKEEITENAEEGMSEDEIRQYEQHAIIQLSQESNADVDTDDFNRLKSLNESIDDVIKLEEELLSQSDPLFKDLTSRVIEIFNHKIYDELVNRRVIKDISNPLFKAEFIATPVNHEKIKQMNNDIVTKGSSEVKFTGHDLLQQVILSNVYSDSTIDRLSNTFFTDYKILISLYDGAFDKNFLNHQRSVIKLPDQNMATLSIKMYKVNYADPKKGIYEDNLIRSYEYEFKLDLTQKENTNNVLKLVYETCLKLFSAYEMLEYRLDTHLIDHSISNLTNKAMLTELKKRGFDSLEDYLLHLEGERLKESITPKNDEIDSNNK